SPQPLLATPRTGTSSTPRSTSPTRAGNVSSLARSPVAPKITSESTWSLLISALSTLCPQPGALNTGPSTRGPQREALDTDPGGPGPAPHPAAPLSRPHRGE